LNPDRKSFSRGSCAWTLPLLPSTRQRQSDLHDQSTTNLCIALSSSVKAVNISSACRFVCISLIQLSLECGETFGGTGGLLRRNAGRGHKTRRRSEGFHRCGAAKTVYDPNSLAQSLWTDALLCMCVHRRWQGSRGTSREKWSGAYLRNTNSAPRRQQLANIPRHVSGFGAAS
jgi:hypothetical protein